MRNKLVMNCEQCGRLVSLQASGEVMKAYSDLDGQLCIVAMWCKRCAANRRENKERKITAANRQIMPLCQGCGKPSSGMCAECREVAGMHAL